MEAYDKIKQLCEEQDIKLSTLAERIGVRSSVFTELKMGRTKKLSVGTLRKISDFFSVPVSYFIDDGESAAENKQEELFRKRKILFDMSGKASEEDLDKIIRIVSAVINE